MAMFMSKAARVGVLLLALALLTAWGVARRPPAQEALAAPNVFSGPINGGCYLETPTSCRIHVDNWQPIVPDTGRALLGFQLVAQADGAGTGAVLYDFRTDVSNPPSGSYLPSLVKQDFAARCGVTYHLTLRAQDTGDLSLEEVGRTTPFRCPAIKVKNFLPVIGR